MSMRIFATALCCAASLWLGACSKSEDAENLQPIEYEGVKVDVPKLAAEFANAPSQLYSQINDAINNIRYKQYMDAMMGLDAVLKTPGLTDKQKKMITNVMEQLKQVVAKAPPQAK